EWLPKPLCAETGEQKFEGSLSTSFSTQTFPCLCLAGICIPENFLRVTWACTFSRRLFGITTFFLSAVGNLRIIDTSAITGIGVEPRHSSSEDEPAKLSSARQATSDAPASYPVSAISCGFIICAACPTASGIWTRLFSIVAAG